MNNPTISVVVPIHKGMKHGDFFLWRLTQSLMRQTFKDFELVITQEGSMPKNTNAGIRKARGELIKILFLDDYLAHENSLQMIVDAIDGKNWLVTGCLHQRTEPNNYEDPHSPHYPEYTHDIFTGNNRIGSPSVLTMKKEAALLFDEKLSFLLDCDLYKRLYHEYGAPKVLNDLNVVIGIHEGQTSNTLPQSEKLKEFEYMKEKYVGAH